MSAKNLVCIAKSLVDLDQRIFAHSNIPMELKIAKGRRIGLGSCAPTVFGSRSQFLLQYNLQAVKMENSPILKLRAAMFLTQTFLVSNFLKPLEKIC